MGTKAGEMRESLMDCIERVKSNTLDSQQAQAIAKLASAISISMQTEARIRLEALNANEAHLPIGAMLIGEEPLTIET